jgi:adenosine deaminase
MSPPIPYTTLKIWKEQVRSAIAVDSFVREIPKVELHVHIEGTMTPGLRWKLANRNKVLLHSKRLNKDFHSLDDLREAYSLLQPRSIKGANQISAFFEAYYGGMDALLVEEDFYELAMAYFERAATMQVRYCEPLFDPQAHTRRGISMATLMAGLRRAQTEAEKTLNVGKVGN